MAWGEGTSRDMQTAECKDTMKPPLKEFESQIVSNHSSHLNVVNNTHTDTHTHTFFKLVLQVLVLFLESFDIFGSHAGLQKQQTHTII